MSYSLLHYGHMLRKSRRRDAYTQALRDAVRPGDVVLDVGTGPGYFAVLAAKLGASHVYAVDLAEQVHIGKAIAAANDVAERITFIQGRVEDVRLPRLVDVVVADLRGVLPFHTGAFTAIEAARGMLRQGGRFIPSRDQLYVAAVDDAAAFLEWSDPWCLAPEGIDLAAGRSFAVNEWSAGHVEPAALLSAPAPWAELDYATLTQRPFCGRAELRCLRAGDLRGLTVWFDTELAAGIGFSNAPGEPKLVYRNALFPVDSVAPVSVGCTVAVDLRTTPVNGEWDWSWHVTLRAPDGAVLLDERHHSMLARPLAALVKNLPPEPKP